mgnify:FL=1
MMNLGCHNPKALVEGKIECIMVIGTFVVLDCHYIITLDNVPTIWNPFRHMRILYIFYNETIVIMENMW